MKTTLVWRKEQRLAIDTKQVQLSVFDGPMSSRCQRCNSLNTFFIAVFSLIAYIVMCSFTNVSEEEMMDRGVSSDVMDFWRQDVVDGKVGGISLPECHAKLNVPEGFAFLDHDQTRKLLVDYWNNPENCMQNVLGVLIPKTAECFYQT